MDRRAVSTPMRMGREEYRRWAMEQPRGRFERVAGEVVGMAAERLEHNRVKMRVWLALRQAVQAAGLPCEVFGDGITVEVGDDTDYEPDAVVSCGQRRPGREIAVPSPVIVAEVMSPSTRKVDTGTKLSDYFRVPSIQHYLIIRADRPSVVHHRRRDDGGIETQILTQGHLALNPPGLTVTLDDFYAD